MNFKLGSILRIIGIILIVVLLAAIKLLIDSNTAQKQNIVVLQKQVTDIQGMMSKVIVEKDKVEADLASVKDEKDRLTVKLSGFESSQGRLRSEIKKLEHMLYVAHEKMVKKEQELKGYLTEKDRVISQLQQKMEAYRSEMSRSQNRSQGRGWGSAGGDNGDGVNNEDQDDAVRMEPTVVQSRRIRLNNDAKILDINKEYDFVVINAGSDNGLIEGDSLNVMRGKKYLGRIVVERVETDVGVARPLYKSLRDIVKRGDKVVF